MPYDPNFPPDHQALVAAPFRDQFNGLKALIDAQAAQLADLQAAQAAQQAHWDALAQQFSTLNPLAIGPADPLTQDEVQVIAAQADAILMALKSV